MCVSLTFDACQARFFRDDASFNASFDYAKADWDSYRSELSCIDEKKLLDSEDVDLIWEEIKLSIRTAASRSIPIKKKQKFF